ncbi:RdRP-domain-containing protein [Hypoxylon trugodes]|uniref:RdRP-domain-containing protein n=1 Tax=Hypoxylon trugodes TaxID=326681 RepID=UPI00218D2FA0|nr:RdRP-domain-containing protein [Hypoxylon trugodes]KAI1389188.1 RdRP-domain-containing protein [Hypoxylon trugodes]
MDGSDVFMTDLPHGLTEAGLRTQLDPIITRKLKITDWTCRKTRGKNFGIVTFLYRQDGEKFLQTHGEITIRSNGRARTRPQLTLLGNGVRCRKSKNDPDPFLLKCIQKTVEDRRLEEEQQTSTDDRKIIFEVRGLSCGHYEYPDGIFTYTADMQWNSKGTAKFARDTIIMTFDGFPIGSTRVEIPYRTIHEVIVDGQPTSLTLTLWEAPRFFQTTGTGSSMAQDLGSLMSGLSVSPSVVGASKVTRVRLSQLPHSSGKHGEILGQSLVYRIDVSPTNFNTKYHQLKAKEKLTVSLHGFPNFLLGRTYMTDGRRTLRELLNDCNSTSIVPFDVLFQFQALAQNGYLLPQTVEVLLRRLCRVVRAESSNGKTNGSNGANGVNGTKKNPFPFSADAVKKLFSQIGFPGPDIEARDFSPDDIWSYLEANEKEVRMGIAKDLISERARENLVMVYKVQVTPTRTTLLGPESEAKNRILRKFPHHTGHFARVQFCEEDGQDLFFNAKVSLDKIWDRFKAVLLQGIQIAGRRYKFLGFSHSSLRAHCVWFMAPFIDHNSSMQTYFSVIADLGKFDKIFSPSRCAARIGQAFSETPFSIDLKEIGAEVEYINDVKSKDGSRVFSDGVGTLSRQLMEAIHSFLPQNRETTTCFQIRWGGAKGMIALDDTLDGMVMRIRPESMVKFESDDIRYLEICDMGNKPIPLVLNRQMIKILEDMGVAADWFFRVQNREIKRLRAITASVHNTMAFLKRQKVAEQINFSKLLRRLDKLGIDYKQDPFLCSVVETVVLREVRLLKHKARIPVEKGVTLFGIMDEFGFLEEDEIYFTFDKKKLKLHGKYDEDEIYDQLVIITRSPALHPGDIQIRRAVRPPPDHPLRSLSNCVVFSQKGQRDLPSELSGGDLDGDIYNIIWDLDAVDSATREFPPADYPRVSPKNIGRPVKLDDMTEFFVEFMATDQLGVIATKHIILADRKDAGSVDDECKLLAEMHSTGVDYSKSGIPMDLNKLRGLTTTHLRPDFLAPAPPANLLDHNEIAFESLKAPLPDDEDEESGPNHRYYKSIKILGQLYQAIDEKKIWRNDIHRNVHRYGESVWDQVLEYIGEKYWELGGPGWKSALEEADNIRQAYDDAIWSATMDYSDNFTKGLSELEVFTGCIFNKSGIQTRRQRDRSVRLKDEFNRIAKWVETLIRKKGVKPRDDDDDDSDSEDRNDPDPSNRTSNGASLNSSISGLELSIACLQASITKSTEYARGSGKFQSFKVIAAQCALSELEIALMQKEYAAGAAFASIYTRI